MKATFENSVNVLVSAYMRHELAHLLCSACAVGNLVCAASGKRPNLKPGYAFRFSDGSKVSWPEIFVTCRGVQKVNLSMKNDAGEAEIRATGYTMEQLARIEYAFESAEGHPDWSSGTHRKDYRFDDHWMFNGLMAVVDVLAEIHGVDLTAKESAIGQFQKVKHEKQTA